MSCGAWFNPCQILITMKIQGNKLTLLLVLKYLLTFAFANERDVKHTSMHGDEGDTQLGWCFVVWALVDGSH